MTQHHFINSTLNLNTREMFKTPFMPGIGVVKIDKLETDNFYGMGVAITGSSCFLLNQMEKSERTAFLKDIYSSDGLDLSVGRLSVASSDYSAELYSYDDVPFDTKLKHFSIERDEAYIIPMIKEILDIKSDLYLFASPWSPPAWMKTGNSLCGGYMRAEFVECYADYIIKFIKAYAEHGIKISALTPQNEPETQQDGNMPACIWHPEIESKFITVLSQKLSENHLDTKIWGFDHNFIGVNRVIWQLENNKELTNALSGIAFHYYQGNIDQSSKIKELFPDLELHYSEGGPRLYDNYSTDYVKWGILISKAISNGYSSFTGWNLLLDEMGGPNIGPFFCGGLVTRNSVTGELSCSGQYNAFKLLSPAIKKGNSLYSISFESSVHNTMSGYPYKRNPVEGFAIESDDSISFFLANPNEEKEQIQIGIDNEWYYAELMPNTISLLVKKQ